MERLSPPSDGASMQVLPRLGERVFELTLVITARLDQQRYSSGPVLERTEPERDGLHARASRFSSSIFKDSSCLYIVEHS